MNKVLIFISQVGSTVELILVEDTISNYQKVSKAGEIDKVKSEAEYINKFKALKLIFGPVIWGMNHF